MTKSGWGGRFRALIARSLAARLLTVALLSSAGLVLVGWLALAQFNQRLLQILIDPEISAVADYLVSNVAPAEDGAMSLRAPPSDQSFLQPISGRYFQVAHIGEDGALDVRIRSPSLYDVLIELPPEAVAELTAPDAPSGSRFYDSPGPDGVVLRIIARVSRIPGMDGRFLFVVGVEPGERVERTAALARWVFTAFVALCMVIVLAVTALQIAVALEPLRKLRRDIADVRRGQAERLEGGYAAELAPVADELNALVDHNREVVERARRHVGNLAHALKTPIAVLKNAAESQTDGAIVRQSIEEMESFVERQLRRARVAARAEAGAGAQAPTIAYRTPVRQNLEDLVFMMEQKYDHQKAIDIVLEVEADVTFRGEREDLLEMAANLIDNACKYGRSAVAIRLEPPQDGLFEIVVEDDGSGLTAAEIERAMARGARLDEAAPGQGLGLSILTETVELYAGELKFERSALGGLKARLRLPATD